MQSSRLETVSSWQERRRFSLGRAAIVSSRASVGTRFPQQTREDETNSKENPKLPIEAEQDKKKAQRQKIKLSGSDWLDAYRDDMKRQLFVRSHRPRYQRCQPQSLAAPPFPNAARLLALETLRIAISIDQGLSCANTTESLSHIHSVYA